MIAFDYVEWTNTLSTGAEPIRVNFREHPSTMIVGRNGHGKSTILDALCYALFNTAYRNVNNGKLINVISNREQRCVVTFEVNGSHYKVTRGQKPAIFEIEKDGKLLQSPGGAAKYLQQMLEKDILGMTRKAFLQANVLGAMYTPFMALTVPERRVLVEDLLDLKVFSSMAAEIKADVKMIESDYEDVETAIEKLAAQISMKEDHVAQLDGFRSKQTDKKAGLQTQLADLQVEIGAINKFILKAEEFKKEYEKKLRELRGLDSAIEHEKGEKAKFKYKIENFDDGHDDSCSKCGQKIPHDEEYFETRRAELRKMKAEVKAIDARLEDLNVQRLALRETIKESEAKVEGQKELYTQQISMKAKINLLKQQIAELEVPDFDYDAEVAALEELKRKQKKEEKTLAQISKTMDLYRTGLKLLADDTIKAYIISQYMPAFNAGINKHLRVLGFDGHFVLNEVFEEVIYARGTDALEYNSLSEGEKQRIELSILFAMRDLAAKKNSISTNILIMDEILDGSMDNDGCGFFLKRLIVELSLSTYVFVITHRPDQMADKFGRIILFEKKNGFSTMREVA